METPAKGQRRRAPRKPADFSVIHVEMNDGLGNARWVTANLVDVLGDGCGLALMTLLRSGSTVAVQGKLGANRAANHLKAAVRWCIAKSDGTFRAGLEFTDGRPTFELHDEPAKSLNPVELDCYEAMQLSPNADARAIARVYRMLAFRYHPDNTETGNSEMFIRLSEAHRILSDPERRYSYDLRYQDAKRHRGTNLDRASVSVGSEWEKRAAAYLGVISSGYTACWEG